MAPLRWEERLDGLTKDTRLDAQGYLFDVAGLLNEMIADSVPQSREAYRNWLVQRCKRVVSAGRERAAVFRLVNGLLWAVDDALSAGDMRAQALWYLHEYGQRRAALAEELVASGARELARYKAILTYGRDLALLSALTAAAEQGSAPKVVLGEGRPRLDGLTMASELAWAGIDVTLGVDMALFGWLPDVDAVVVGAESLSARGLIYRRGTAALAEAAYARELPFYVICSRADFMSAEYVSGIESSAGDPEEISPESHERITVRNVLWDLTPIDRISAVITGQGMLAGEALVEALRMVRVYPGLVGR